MLEKTNARVNVINKNNFQQETVEVTAYYCRTCNRYYILERDYSILSNMGVICCQVIDLKDLNDDGYEYLRKKSLPGLYGYNVSKKAGLSAKERRLILDMIISNHVWSKNRCIGFIKWLIEKNCRKKNMDDAIAKWNSDIDYLRGGKNIILQTLKLEKYMFLSFLGAADAVSFFGRCYGCFDGFDAHFFSESLIFERGFHKAGVIIGQQKE